MDCLNIVQWNAQSLISNLHAFTYFLYNNNIHIALVSETWLKPGKSIKIKGYNIERLDIGSKHNGVAILIQNNLSYNKLVTYNDSSLQNLAIQLHFNSEIISMISFYSPTLASPCNFTYSYLDNLIKSVPGPLIMAGDFNAHNTIWGCSSTDSRGSILQDIIDDNNLCLLNNGQVTTVGSHVWRPNALDLTIVSPSLSLRCSWSVHDDPLGSYHLPTVTSLLSTGTVITNNSNINQGNYSRPSFSNVDWKQYQVTINNKLKHFHFDISHPQESYTNLCSLLLDSAFEASHRNNSYQNQINTIRKKKPCLPWWNQICSSAVETSKNAYVQFKSNPNLENFINFKKQQAIKKITLKREREASWTALCESFNRQTPLSVIWKTMRMFNKSFSDCNINRSPNIDWIPAFLNKYTSDSPNFVTDVINSSINRDNEFLIKPFTLCEFNSALNSRRDTAFGLDHIPYKLLKSLSLTDKKIILDIFNFLWSSDIIPYEWKSDCLIPILKPGKDSNNYNSYRPIALTSCVGKVFEQLLKQRLEFYIESKKILPSNQFGFRRGFSAIESLNHLYLDIHNSCFYT